MPNKIKKMFKKMWEEAAIQEAFKPNPNMPSAFNILMQRGSEAQKRKDKAADEKRAREQAENRALNPRHKQP